MINIGEEEKVIKSIGTKKNKITLTERRVIIETSKSAYSFLIEIIGGVQIVKGGKCGIRLFSKTGENLLKYEKYFKVVGIKKDDAILFESILGVLLQK